MWLRIILHLFVWGHEVLQNQASQDKIKQSLLDEFNGLNEFNAIEGRDAGLDGT